MADRPSRRLALLPPGSLVRSWFLAAIALAAVAASPCRADVTDDVAALRKKVDELEMQVRALQAQAQAQAPQAVPAGPIERFNGTWEGKIIGDKRHDCRDGELRATVRAGQLEGTRWFFAGYLAPIKGTIKPDGSYEGIQNRAFIAGKFTEDSADLWPLQPDGACENKMFLRKVGPL